MITRARTTYLAVAGCCLALHNAVLIAADALGIALWIAVAMSFTIVVCAGYLLHASFTFRERLSLAGIMRYGTAMSVNIPLAYVSTWFCHVVVELNMPVAAPIASSFMLVFNYGLGRWAIEKRMPESQRP